MPLQNVLYLTSLLSAHIMVSHLRRSEGRGQKCGNWTKIRAISRLGSIPWANARLDVRAPWAESEDKNVAKTLFGMKRKHFPVPLHWLAAQSPLAFAGFSQLSPLWSYEDIFSPWTPDRQIKTRHPCWVTMQVNLINAITVLVTNHTKMRFIKAKISMALQREQPDWPWLISLRELWLCFHRSLTVGWKKKKEE